MHAGHAARAAGNGGRVGRPHAAPVGFRYNPELGVVDVPWPARDVEVRGRAEALGGEGLIRIFSKRIVGWDIDPDAPSPNAKSAAG